MKEISVGELKVGMRFTRDVLVDGVNILVPRNEPLRERDLRNLKKWKVETVTTHGELIDEEAERERTSLVNLAFNDPNQQVVRELYQSIASQLENTFKRITVQDDSVTREEVDRVVDRIIKALDSRQTDLVHFIIYGIQGTGGPVQNAINACILSVLIGRNLELAKHRVLQLATAALLHDAGMLRIPEAITGKQGKLTDEERKQIMTHPVRSYRIVAKEMGYPEEIGLAALQHQERWDGKGYPRGLSGTNIVLPARIIAVVDAFEAMVSNRPYRNPVIGHTAIRGLLADNGRRFDPNILKAFVATMGIYPVGSVVLLNDARIGRVVDMNPGAPIKPKVKIMINAEGEPYRNDEGEVVNLSAQPGVHIARAIDPREIQSNGDGD